MTTAKERTDALVKETADKIIALLEAGEPGTWLKPWIDVGGVGLFTPRNAVTGGRYSGFNPIRLATASIEAGYSSHLWATYRQWKSIDCQVRKGEKGTTCVRWVTVRRNEEDKVTGEEKRKSFVVPKTFTLFAAEQVEGEVPTFEAPGQSWGFHDEAEFFIEAQEARIEHGGSRAFYAPVQDYISLPAPESFTSQEGYYGTALHELTHWTGHESRLGRDLKNRFGSEAYAIEELVAELGAATLCSHLGVTPEPRPDHALYVKSWIKVLKEDPKALLKVTGDAGRAAEFLIERAEAAVPEAPHSPGIGVVLAA